MIITSFKGLNVQSNSFKSAEGYLEVAHNVIISREDIIQKVNGFEIFYDTLTDTPLALEDYKDKLIVIGDTYIKRIDQTAGGAFSSITTLTGQTIEITTPRSAQAAGNLFVLTDNFVLKMESASASLLKAGVPKAPDLTYFALGSGTVNDAPAGIHSPDTQIGYRVIFGRKDLNANTVLGAPSELTQNQNVLYSSVAIVLSTYDVAVQYTAHGLLVNDFVTIRSSNGSNPAPDGEYTVTAVADANHFTFSTAAVLSSAPVGVTSLQFGIRRKPKLEFTLPSGVDTTFFYRVYRTNASISNDVEPDESTLQLIEESNVSSTNVSNGYIQFTDTVDDLFKTTYLYTNPNTGEGILEANFPPPIANDISLFKNHLFLSYPTTNYTLNIGLIRASASTFANNDYVDVIQTSNIKNATTSTWQSGTTVRYTISTVTHVQVGQFVLFTGFSNAANNGKFIITTVGASYIDCTNAGRTDASLNESSVTAARAYPIRRYTAAASESFNTALGGNFKLSTGSASVSTNIDATARSICKTINRDTYSNCYASYTSSSQALPGQISLYGRVVTDIFALQANTATVGANFDPTIPNTVTDLSIIGTNNVYPNGIFISKPNEFEAFPLTSFMFAGSKDAAILRVCPLKNSLIIIKEDGIFRLAGTNRSDFSIVPLDTSVRCIAPESVVELKGNLYALTLDGVVQISETNVAVMSRLIAPLLSSVFSDADFAANTFATRVQDDGLYLLTTITPNDGESTTYSYNSITNTWTTLGKLLRASVIKLSDKKFYALSTAGLLLRMRKLNDKTDFCDENDTVISITNLAADSLSCDVLSPLVLTAGDVLIFDDVINRISEVDGSTCTFYNNVNFTESDLPEHYKSITSIVEFSPVAEEENTLYQFSEISMHFRNLACTTLDIGFISDANEVEERPWGSDLLEGGWGDLGWGVFEFGLSETTAINLLTYSAPPVRIDVPIETQISTWLKVAFTHSQAAESINLQGLGFIVRRISERISK